METYPKKLTAVAVSDRERPKLTVEQQIEHLKNDKGIKFGLISEKDAARFLTENTYLFKIKSYAKNYSKYSNNPDESLNGKYCNLDFAYLVELSTIDMFLREKILKLTLNIEHFLKVQLLNDVSNNSAEDGYAIVKDYLNSVNPGIKDTINNKESNPYCGDLIKHRKRFAIWDFVEVLSIGEFIEFYKYYYSKYPKQSHKMENNLKSVQWLRNAAAHNNCIINHLDPKRYAVGTVNQQVNVVINKIPGISNKMATKKMSNRPVHDFIVTLYVFNMVVSSNGVKRNTMREIKELFDDRFVKHKDYFRDNQLISSNYIFVKKVIDYFHNLCNNI